MVPLTVTLTKTASLSADALRAHVTLLASDALEGRGAATRGIHVAADYLEKQLREIGLAPAFGDSYRQPFEMLVGTQLGKKNALVQGKTKLRAGTDFRPFPFSRTGTASGALVFAGYGIRADQYKYDDYEGLDVAGKVVVILDGEPGEDDPKSPFDGRKTTPASSIRRKVLVARHEKAAALILVRTKLKKLRRRLDPESDAGIVSVEMTTPAASRLLGFDVTALKKAIDADYRPHSRSASTPAPSIQTEIIRERRTVDNVGGILVPEGGAKEWIVIGAHYDHLGYGSSDSLADGDEPQIHNGADDNASGTAVVVEAARAIVKMKDPLSRGVLFVLFAGEESGLLGSAHLVKNPPVPIKDVAAMINLDMVGHLREKKLYVMGVKTALELEDFARRLVADHGLAGNLGGDGYGPSDQTSFYAAGVPVLFLFTGAHSRYHKPTDDADTLNYPGMAEVGSVATDLVRALAMAKTRLTYVRAPAPKLAEGGRGYGPYFGSIPDFGETENGVLLSGVREGSPASKAGVKKGDVIVKFGEYEVRNLQDMTIALREHAPGDEVVVVYVRDGKRIETKAVLKKRE